MPILKYFKNFFTRKSPHSSQGTLDDDGFIRVISYPPSIHGIPVIKTSRLLDKQSAIIQKIKDCCGEPEKVWDEIYYPVIVNYVEFVHLVPASERNHHRLAGGLLRHGLETALWALQLADKHMFAANEIPEKRKRIERRWIYAAFIAGICHDIGKPVSDMQLVSEDGKREWNPFKETIAEWAKPNKQQKKERINAYFIRWRKDNRHKRHENLSPLVIDRVVTAEARSYMSEGGPELMKQLMLAVEGQGYGVLTDIMHEADKMSVAKDKETMGIIEEGGTGVPVAKHIIEAIQALAESKSWEINKEGSPLWYMLNDLYIIWPKTAEAIFAYTKEKGVKGIPSNPEVIMEILTEHALIVQNDGQGKWYIAPEPLTRKNAAMKLQALRFQDPYQIVDVLPNSIDGKVVLLNPKPESTSDTEEGKPETSKQDAPEKTEAEVPATTPDAPIETETRTEPEPTEGKEATTDTTPTELYDPTQNRTKELSAISKDAKERNQRDDYHIGKLKKTMVELIKYLAEDIAGGEFLGVNGAVNDGKLSLRWPDVCKLYGSEPKLMLKELKEKGFVVADKFAPAKLLSDTIIGAVHTKTLTLNEDLTREIMILANKKDLIEEKQAVKPKVANTGRRPPNIKTDDTNLVDEVVQEEPVTQATEAASTVSDTDTASKEPPEPSAPESASTVSDTDSSNEILSDEAIELLQPVFAAINDSDCIMHNREWYISVRTLSKKAREFKLLKRVPFLLKNHIVVVRKEDCIKRNLLERGNEDEK